MKIPLSVLAAVAKKEGYKGDAGDGAAMKAFLLGLAEPLDVIEYAGEDVLVKDLDFAAKSARKVKADPESVKETNGLPIDWEAKAKAIAEEMLEKAGFKRTGETFTPINPDGRNQITSIKSGAERQYERRIKDGRAVFDSFDEAKAWTGDMRIKYLRATGKHEAADADEVKQKEWLGQKGYTITTEGAGGALVPEGFDANLIRLVKDYGMARKACRMVDMNTDTFNRPKVTTIGLTIYYPNDGAAGTETTETFGRVIIKAKQGVGIVKMSRAVLDDSMINMFEDTARELTRAIAKIEDNTLFNGDGSGNGAAGLYIPSCRGLINMTSTDTTTNSRTLNSAADTADAYTLTNLTSFMGLCPSFARNVNTAFHCTPEVMNIVLTRLAMGGGGVTFRDFMDYGDVPYAFGRPVILNNVMPANNSDNAQYSCDMIFGDISLAADFGSRKGIEIDISDQRYWDSVNIGVRAVVRHDINVHDVGSTTVQSPVVFLTQT